MYIWNMHQIMFKIIKYIWVNKITKKKKTPNRHHIDTKPYKKMQIFIHFICDYGPSVDIKNE